MEHDPKVRKSTFLKTFFGDAGLLPSKRIQGSLEVFFFGGGGGGGGWLQLTETTI